jgi:DNA topoisomerase-2|tara:strand:- start:675 stop:4187 length:3513 start_codon:yes stop_codon:yes gene_type:complete
MSSTDLAQQYQRKTDKQHVLDNPDTYIGSVEIVDCDLWIFNDNKIDSTNIEYVPGLYKLFDEGIVNCRDHVIRMNQSTASNKRLVSHIDIDVDSDSGMITMLNDGNGIDVAKHPTEDLWIPEMIFGHLRTSTNYDKTQKKIVGGKNGFGFKLVLIWSKWGRIETVDHTRGLKYVQEFHNNLEKIDPPKITKSSSTKPYTKVSFIPDYERFGVPKLSQNMIALLKKRVYDIAAVTEHSSSNKLKVNYNGLHVPVKNFQQYLDLYIGSKDDSKRVYERPDDRWEYAVALAPKHEFTQISFVNGICTFKGGKHVDYILGQILRKLCAYIEKKKKIVVNQVTIKEQLILFVRCDIENPSFDSQTKDFMNTPSARFGSQCTVSDNFIEKIAKMGVMDMACQLTETKEAGKTKKKMDGSKSKNIRGIPNFVDANFAGTDKSNECTLILAEGLSAMSGIVSGLQSEDRNIIGIYPLKGKVLNVRGATRDISENRELADLIKILGLEIGKEYKSMTQIQKELRYSKIMIMSDQDLDGSHIKGLCINLFHSMWPSLVQLDGFLSFMNTPILRATKGKEVLRFYNEGEHRNWKKTFPKEQPKGWILKYFKGLGTSTSTEFKEYFANKKVVDFQYNGGESDNTVDMVFNKKRTEDRKRWLEQYDKHAYLDTSYPLVPYETFFHKEMVHFSVYDCERSIPNMVDGLKTSLRKILFSAFKRKLNTEVKVAQFSGYVSENSAYHHGEASLNGAIVNMAQNYVGSNNLNLLVPNGQFGTRLKGGEDSASERYIFTQLNPLTRAIFPEADDPVLDYLDDDGQLVEPEYYVPIIPFSLVNGITGIGTGFSCTIPSYNPLQLVDYLKKKLDEESLDGFDFIPYYEGFTGTVQKVADNNNKFLIRGKYEKLGEDKILITELPIGTWTMNYLTFLEDLMDSGSSSNNDKKKKGGNSAPIVKDFVNMSTEVHVHITVQFTKGKLVELESTVEENTTMNGVEKVLKLSTTISSTNMNMFNGSIQLHKYNTVQDIIDNYYTVRVDMYGKRKAAQVKSLESKVQELSNRAQFITEVVSGKIDLRKMADDNETYDLLQKAKFDKVDDKYDYLTHMPMHNMNKSRVEKIKKEREEAVQTLDILRKTTVTMMWKRELDVFVREYSKYKQEREKLQFRSSNIVKTSIVKVVKKRSIKK